MIITEISKEVGYNNIARVNAYVRQYVSRGVRAGETGPVGSYGGGRSLEDHMEEVVVLGVVEPVCICIRLC